MEAPAENAVTRWFGAHFPGLHPLLQRLHRHGGTLAGQVQIHYGDGIAGWLGRRIARKLGLPSGVERTTLEVRIHHSADALHWDRCFGGAHKMCSTFTPFGQAAAGYWVERTGTLRLHLDVDTSGGAWRWRCLRAYIGKLAIPLWLLPRVDAYRRIEHGRYRFGVTIAMTGLGTLLSYGGLLDIADSQGGTHDAA